MTHIALHHRRLIVGVAVTMLTTLLIAVGGTAPAEGRDLQWHTCYQDVTDEIGLGVGYECTQVRVPLDHDRPDGATISLALVRIPASDQANHKGSLFLNPGGPGGSGIDFALNFGPFAPFIWGPVANQYDIVGFDPRGIARSTPLRCFGTVDRAVQVFPPVPFPSVEEEIPLFETGFSLLNDHCVRRGGMIVEHMSTANVAHDLDLLREAVGDEHTNYAGLSYGSYLGQTYANLYPDRVGAFVIDGVLDPVAWANLDADVPFSTALRSDVGAQATLDEFLAQCDAAGAGNCAFAPDAATRFEALAETLKTGPIDVVDPFTGETITYFYSFLIGDTLGALYNPGAFADLAQYLAYIESQASPAVLGLARQEMLEAAGLAKERQPYDNFVEGFPAVACEDTSNPTTGMQAWYDAGVQSAELYGYFGEIWTWASAPCAVWSSVDDDVYTGPYATGTVNPVLVIGNLYDPATRYEGAQTANGLLSDSVLITVDEPGHTSLGISGCAGFLTGQYLADPVGYASGTGDAFCPSEGNWFDKLAAAGVAGENAAEFRTELMDAITFRP